MVRLPLRIYNFLRSVLILDYSIILYFPLLVFRVKIYHGAIVCKETKIRGDVTIGSMTVVHPCATIIADAGPIVIGDGNIIEEQVVIVNR